MAANKDARMKAAVKLILENCRLDDLVIDREVQINFSGKTTQTGTLVSEKEIDVAARFTYAGQTVILLFECEDSNKADQIRKEYSHYSADIDRMNSDPDRISVIGSQDQRFKPRHFQDVDEIRACFVYGERFPDYSYRYCQQEAKPYSFLVWNHLALSYYQIISSTLKKWTKFELFKDFSLSLESAHTFSIDAIELEQRDKRMYLGKIHPGQLLKIGYVVRRAHERTYAYQRLLNKSRIEDIAAFISSARPAAFLPSTIIAVFDPEIGSKLKYDSAAKKLTIPLTYCSAWIIDGQHRAYGFLGTRFEHWTHEKFFPFDLPIVLFRHLPLHIQTQTFININYYQKRIKTDLLCDLAALTEDLKNELTWVSLIGIELSRADKSPFKNRIKTSELHFGRPISLVSFVRYGLLETLLGHKRSTGDYTGSLFRYAPFDKSKSFRSSKNQKAFRRQVQLLDRFFLGVMRNTETDDAKTNPWSNTKEYSLLKATGVNALLMVLARILLEHPTADMDFEQVFRPISRRSFRKNYVANMGSGWRGFRGLANAILRKLNKGKFAKNPLLLYGEKEK